MNNFLPNVWAPPLLDQLKASIVFAGPPFIGPRPKPVLYRLVDENDALASVLDDEMYGYVLPDHDRAEAVQVMLDALNVWIKEKLKEN